MGWEPAGAGWPPVPAPLAYLTVGEQPLYVLSRADEQGFTIHLL